MASRITKTSVAAALIAATFAHPATAQVGSLGKAVSNALSREGQLIDQANQGAKQGNAPANPQPAPPKPQAASGAQLRGGRVVQAQLSRGDALAGTNATTCRQANGTTIRVSGGFRPPADDPDECR